jgi:hypothetical protein
MLMSEEQPAQPAQPSEPPQPAEPSPARPDRAWRVSPTNAAPAAKTAAGAQGAGARRWKTFLLLVTILTLCGVVLAWVFLLRRFTEPYFLAIPITEYRGAGLPRNTCAEKDCDLLKKHFANNHVAFNFQERRQLEGLLHSLADEKYEKTPVVVYLAAYAVYCAGEVYILPGDAQLKKPATWVPLVSVVKSLRQCKSPHRLLILDVMQHPIADPCPDVADVDGAKADNDIAKHVHDFLKNELNKDNEPSLRVLCACGPGQVSLVDKQAGHSVFGIFLDKGLLGAAASFKRQHKDRYISVEDLATFVAEHVDRWAKQNESRQTPVLLGKGEDFNLTIAP